MNCPVCKKTALSPHDLEANLQSLRCARCGGHWVKSFQYWKWREAHGPDLPEKPPEQGAALEIADTETAKLCPECGHILRRYRVGHSLGFSLDRCGNCGGVWFDRNEWEALKSRNLHDDVHFVFGQPWQAAVAKEEHVRERERLLRERFGEADLAEIRGFKAWMDAHPKRSEVLALLTYPYT